MKNRSLSFKMYFVMILLSTGSCVITVLGLSRMGHINDVLKSVITEKSARISMIKDIRSVFYLQLMNEKSYLLEENPEKTQKISALMEKRHQEILSKVDELYKISSEVGKDELDKFKASYGQWWSNTNDVREFISSGNRDKARMQSETTGQNVRTVSEDLINSTVERNEERMSKEAQLAAEDYQSAKVQMIGVSLFTILLGLGVGTVILRSLGKSISEIIEVLSSSSAQVSAASQQIASASVQLSEATTEQASSLEETVATIEELSSMVKVNADNASHAASLSGQTNATVGRGETEMKTLIISMSAISSDSKKIADIINVIDDIAFQTNLLALNASVEAARAGEQGKGFAVVADAVRTLAQRSSVAAKDISELIKSSVDRIAEGSSQVERSGAVLTEILESVTKMSQLNQEISTASSEQANGITQIGKAMNQLDQVTQVNAASSEEAAASAEELSAQAESLSTAIQTLVQVVRGAGSSVQSVQVRGSSVRKSAARELVPLDSVA